MRALATAIALALAVVACGASSTEPSASAPSESGSSGTAASDPAVTDAPSTSSAPAPVATPPTTEMPTPTTTEIPVPTTEEPTAAEALVTEQEKLVQFIAENSVEISPVKVGTLAADGAIISEADASDVAGSALNIRVLLDVDGAVWFAVFGPPEELANTWIEFDGLAADGFTVVAETSVIGVGEGPSWVESAPNGSVIVLNPPDASAEPQGLQSPDWEIDGYLFEGDIGVIEAEYRRNSAENLTQGVVDSLSIWEYLPKSPEDEKVLAYVNRKFDMNDMPKASDVSERHEEYLQRLEELDLAAKLAQINPRLYWQDITTPIFFGD